MNKFYKIKFDPNKRYFLEICSLEKRYIYYRDNFKRICIENHKLQKENEELKHLSGIDIYKLGQKTQRDRTNFEIDKLQKEIKELREELQHYKDNIIEDLENRDRWE